jgi:hypothetical protein
MCVYGFRWLLFSSAQEIEQTPNHAKRPPIHMGLPANRSSRDDKWEELISGAVMTALSS